MADENKDIAIPSWINMELLQKVYLNFEQADQKVESFKTDLATAPGDNYISVMYRVVVRLSDGNVRQFLIKTIPAGGEMISWVKETDCFTRESMMLVEIVPKIEAVLEKTAPGRWGHLAARCPLHGKSPDIFIVMEDLRPQGFHLADRKLGLGLRHSLIAIRALARFHAAGHFLLKRDPELIGRIDSFYSKQTKNMTNLYTGGMAAAAEVCRTWPGYEECSRRLEKFTNTFVDTITQINEPKPKAFNVIVHGDYWTNNMLFRYDEDRDPTDMRMVDFQLSHVASPAIDLLYFFTTSLRDDVSINHQDLLIREYYFTLKETLSLLGTEVPSFQTLLRDINNHGPHALFGTIVVVPFVKATKVPDLEAAMSGDKAALAVLYNTPDIKNYLQRMLPEFLRKGWIPV